MTRERSFYEEVDEKEEAGEVTNKNSNFEEENDNPASLASRKNEFQDQNTLAPSNDHPVSRLERSADHPSDASSQKHLEYDDSLNQRENTISSALRDHRDAAHKEIKKINQDIKFRDDIIRMMKINTSIANANGVQLIKFQHLEEYLHLIGKYNKIDNLLERALVAFDEGKRDQAGYLFWQANPLLSINLKMTNNNPNILIVVGYYKLSYYSFRDATAAFDQGKFEIAQYSFCEAKTYFSIGNELAENSHRREDIINNYHKSTDLFVQALGDLKEGKSPRCIYLFYQGKALFYGTQEKAKINPNEEIVGDCNKRYELYREALEALDSGDSKKAINLHNEALSLKA